MSFDNLCKILAEKYPTDFTRWLLPDKPQKIQVLKAELSIELIRSNSVIFLHRNISRFAIWKGFYSSAIERGSYAEVSDLSGYFAEGWTIGRTKRSG